MLMELVQEFGDRCKRPKLTVLLSVHEWVKWTLAQVWI